ncbi:MAG: ATP-dependent DNA ligase [Isosphaeraceae bacterium]
MKAFADLYAALDETTKTNEKVGALRAYFAAADPADAAWAVYFLIGRKPRQAIASPKLRTWSAAEAGVPDWLFQECYDAVGDVAETIALLLPQPEASSDRSLSEWVERLLSFKALDEDAQRAQILSAWREMDRRQRFVWNKLISGAFRVGVSQQLVIRALSQVVGVEAATIAHRLMGDWQPSPRFYESLHRPDPGDADLSRPYPFCLAHPIEGEPGNTLGEATAWQAEWKWDGIRAQFIRRGGQAYLWTRGEELVTERYPEIAGLGALLPDGAAIDGELLPWKGDAPLPFAQLQRRIGRKTIGKKLLEEVPVVLVAYDLLEHEGRDIREEPLETRRSLLATLIETTAVPSRFRLSPVVAGSTWEDLARARAESRAIGSEGLMLKRLGSPYRVGRVRGDWWKWKIEPYSIDAVLTAARRGSGKRASLYTDYTFSVWDNDRLVPIAQAYSGLTDDEIRKVDAFVRTHMVEAFGPVRTVKPELVFELAFEGLQTSTRHKSGIAVRFPRILRWRTDKLARDADTLETIRAMLEAHAGPSRDR